MDFKQKARNVLWNASPQDLVGAIEEALKEAWEFGKESGWVEEYEKQFSKGSES